MTTTGRSRNTAIGREAKDAPCSMWRRVDAAFAVSHVSTSTSVPLTLSWPSICSALMQVYALTSSLYQNRWELTHLGAVPVPSVVSIVALFHSRIQPLDQVRAVSCLIGAYFWKLLIELNFPSYPLPSFLPFPLSPPFLPIFLISQFPGPRPLKSS